MTDRLKVYLETSFVNYLTGRLTSNVKIASEQACPAVMTPKTFIENTQLEDSHV